SGGRRLEPGQGGRGVLQASRWGGGFAATRQQRRARQDERPSIHLTSNSMTRAADGLTVLPRGRTLQLTGDTRSSHSRKFRNLEYARETMSNVPATTNGTGLPSNLAG